MITMETLLGFNCGCLETNAHIRKYGKFLFETHPGWILSLTVNLFHLVKLIMLNDQINCCPKIPTRMTFTDDNHEVCKLVREALLAGVLVIPKHILFSIFRYDVYELSLIVKPTAPAETDGHPSTMYQWNHTTSTLDTMGPIISEDYLTGKTLEIDTECLAYTTILTCPIRSNVIIADYDGNTGCLCVPMSNTVKTLPGLKSYMESTGRSVDNFDHLKEYCATNNIDSDRWERIEYGLRNFIKLLITENTETIFRIGSNRQSDILDRANATRNRNGLCIEQFPLLVDSLRAEIDSEIDASSYTLTFNPRRLCDIKLADIDKIIY